MILRLTMMALLLSAPAAVVAANDAAATVEQIGWGWGGWTSGHEVSVDRNGRVVIEDAGPPPPPPMPCPPPSPGAPQCTTPEPLKGIRKSSFSVGPAGFAQLRDILSPLVRPAGNQSPKPCRPAIPDGPRYGISWKIDGRPLVYRFGYSCSKREQDRSATILTAVDDKLKELMARAGDMKVTDE